MHTIDKTSPAPLTHSGLAIIGLLPLLSGFAEVPGGTLDPERVPKYTDPLVIPPVLYDDQGGSAPLDVEVALRQFSQQVLPTRGCISASLAQVAHGGEPIACQGDGFPATTLWGYGDPDEPATFNNPAFTIEVTKDTPSYLRWSNELVVNPDPCRASGQSDAAACAHLPHIIQDAEGVPVIDPTLHWANPTQVCASGPARTDCRGPSAAPYFGPVPMVTHVHGAHVGPESDGYPEAWWLPAASDIPPGYARSGTYFNDATWANPGDLGYADYVYRNDQPSATLWYHDHTLGITRLNVYAAAAGFWLIRREDEGETGLLVGTLPGPAPTIYDSALALNSPGDPVRAAIREIPLAIQPKSFNADGSQFYPANRAFFEDLGDGQVYAENVENGLDIAFSPAPNSDIAPVWNPEVFFNTMVVNGATWPRLEVAPERYRLRLLNAADSRFLNLALLQVNGQGKVLRELPIYQIGAEQGLLPRVVRIETGFATALPGDGSDVHPRFRDCLLPNHKPKPNCVPAVPGTFPQQALLLAPAERADIIVDFSGLEQGDRVIMVNTGPDAPFGGFPDDPADPATTGQVMRFEVNAALSSPDGDPSTPAPALVLDPNPGGAAKLGAPDGMQDLALLEEESALVCVVFDLLTDTITQVEGLTPPNCGGLAVPFGPAAALLGTNGSGGGDVQLWSDPIQQNPKLGDIEQWELWNWSADAHPIHLHLVKFEVVNREVIGGAVRPPEPWEAGWKDTVIAYPNEITRIKAHFDIAGLFVWHCHMLAHEDNEMMVPYCVGEAGVDCPAELF